MNIAAQSYYVPASSHWPLIGTLGLSTTVIGAVNLFHKRPSGPYVFLIGSLLLAYMMYGWFAAVIKESQQGLYSEQMDRSFRLGMVWFIFSEVMFFGAFFAALYYARTLSVPWLAGMGDKAISHLLWQDFKFAWPLLHNPDPTHFANIKAVMSPWGLAALNTFILLSSSSTLTLAHHALKAQKRRHLNIYLGLTIILALVFLSLQAYEYHHAYTELALTLNSGIYGTTFFMLTGFHGAHVSIGTIMLSILLIRCLKGHFSERKHFAFEAIAWYWHFVDVIWLILFIFVYWL